MKKKNRFLKSEHHSLLERNNALTQEMKSSKSSSSVNEMFHLGAKVLNKILDKCKIHGNKRGLGYINKYETPSNGETMFVKGEDETLIPIESHKKTSLCTHCKKIGHLI